MAIDLSQQPWFAIPLWGVYVVYYLFGLRYTLYRTGIQEAAGVPLITSMIETLLFSLIFGAGQAGLLLLIFPEAPGNDQLPAKYWVPMLATVCILYGILRRHNGNRPRKPPGGMSMWTKSHPASPG